MINIGLKPLYKFVDEITNIGAEDLGLAIVDSILKAHNGFVTVKRNRPHDLIVTLYFPK
ncbi:MAG: hypothetical protein KAT71_00190 [Gammaproteobacteria bacterium]|nr:hypothetical protein [Gammaproteobacteria bacterium]